MTFELWVLDALARHERLSALEIYHLADDSGVRCSLGLIYSTMETFVKHGWAVEELEMEKSRPVVYWRLLDEGRRAKSERRGSPFREELAFA